MSGKLESNRLHWIAATLTSSLRLTNELAITESMPCVVKTTQLPGVLFKLIDVCRNDNADNLKI